VARYRRTRYSANFCAKHAAEVVWRPRAARQLNQIFDYIHQHSPSAAVRYLSELRRACELLGELPEKAPRYNDRYRALAFRNHLVFYRFAREDDQVLIIAILDARRDVPAILRNLGDE
jgi:plasmid stabilization system protein ParE